MRDVVVARGRSRCVGPHGWSRRRVYEPHSPPLIFGDIQALEGLHVYFDFYSLVQSVIAKFKGPRRIQAWLCALACSTTLALLTSLLWLAP